MIQKNTIKKIFLYLNHWVINFIMINIFQPSLNDIELNEIKKVFNSNWIGKGDYVLEFEKRFAKQLRKKKITLFQ